MKLLQTLQQTVFTKNRLPAYLLLNQQLVIHCYFVHLLINARNGIISGQRKEADNGSNEESRDVFEGFLEWFILKQVSNSEFEGVRF